MIASNSIRWLLDDCCLYEPSASGKLQLNICELVGNLAYHAMMLEAHLTPKPGLVDCESQGAHTDMDIHTFIASSEALRPYMKQFVRIGLELHKQPESDLLPGLRQVGIEAEQAMFSATDGVNTHKGMIFTMGLICGAAGWLYGNNQPYRAEDIQRVIASTCAELVTSELSHGNKTPSTAGERLYQQHGLTGIRGEAASGYPTIFNYGLPVYEQAMELGYSEEQAMSRSLLSLMANNCDTNLVHRGGLEGLSFVREIAHQEFKLFDHRSDEQNEEALQSMDRAFIACNLSPGGSADLLAATWLCAQLNLCSGS